MTARAYARATDPHTSWGAAETHHHTPTHTAPTMIRFR